MLALCDQARRVTDPALSLRFSDILFLRLVPYTKPSKPLSKLPDRHTQTPDLRPQRKPLMMMDF